MVYFPNAKINLGLFITEKRSDSFHNLETIFYPIPWTDILEVIPAETVQFTSSGIEIPGDPEDNLCLRAYYLLQKDFNLPPVHIHLRKEIPMGAGLGGGSSDAACTLHAVCDLFNLGLDKEQLADYARQLGSDCAFFIYNTPHLAKGKGDELHPIQLSLKDLYLVVVYPGIHISTKMAYASIKPSSASFDLSTIGNRNIDEWQGCLKNDFEENVFAEHPEIASIKQQLLDKGAVLSSMSGSGSAVFGVFEEKTCLNFNENYIVKQMLLGA